MFMAEEHCASPQGNFPYFMWKFSRDQEGLVPFSSVPEQRLMKKNYGEPEFSRVKENLATN